MGKTTFTYGHRRRDLGLVGCLAHLLFSAQPVASQSRPLVRQWDEALGYYNSCSLSPSGYRTNRRPVGKRRPSTQLLPTPYRPTSGAPRWAPYSGSSAPTPPARPVGAFDLLPTRERLPTLIRGEAPTIRYGRYTAPSYLRWEESP